MYSQTNHPIREMLGQLTSIAAETRADSFDTYIRLREMLHAQELHPDVYCSTSMTSGGHARNASLNMPDIIARNTKLALAMCDELFHVGQLSPLSSIEAAAVGKIPHWGQSDYLEFWLLVMAGFPSSGRGIARIVDLFRKDLHITYEQSNTLDMGIYNSSEFSPEQRALHYFEHAILFAQTLKTRRSKISPVKRVVRLIDPERSLGAQTENVFAQIIGAHIYTVGVAKRNVMPSKKHINHFLIEDSTQIVRFGGTIFDNRDGQQLIILPQDDITWSNVVTPHELRIPTPPHS